MDSFVSNGITGHRGNSAGYPENTLPSFASAIELGVDWIELDVRRSLDGRLIVIHDATTGRTCDADLSVSDSSSRDLRRLNAAARHPGSGTEAKLPFLEEVLELIGSQNHTRVSIQPKVNCVADICALLKTMQLSGYAGFNDGCPDILKTAKGLLPETVIFYDLHRREDTISAIETARAGDFHSIVQFHPQIHANEIEMIRAAGLEAGAWTVNDPAEALRLQQAGISRFYTDCPETMLELFNGGIVA